MLRPLVPLTAEVATGGDGRPVQRGEDGPAAAYEFEPDPVTILDSLLPRYVEARVYAALLNAAASEHAFTQRAMKSATDNAEELIKTLSRIMNRARQDTITTEIMEIVSGAEALGAGKRDPPPFASSTSSRSTPSQENPDDHHRERTDAVARPRDGSSASPARSSTSSSPAAPCPSSTRAVEFDIVVGGDTIKVLAEVAQQLGEGRVRAICMKPTDGLTRGTSVRNTGQRHHRARRREGARPRLERVG